MRRILTEEEEAYLPDIFEKFPEARGKPIPERFLELLEQRKAGLPETNAKGRSNPNKPKFKLKDKVGGPHGV